MAELSAWFADYQAKLWDEQIERDLDEGRLDALLEEVDAAYEAGKARPLSGEASCSSRFWRRYCGLPKHAQKLADQKFELLEANPLGLHYRASERETRGHGLVLDRTHTRNMTGCLHE